MWAFRSQDGAWLLGFTIIVGKSRNFQTETRVIYKKFSITWKESFRQIEVESDNVILIDIINNHYAMDNNLSEVRLIHSLLVKDWQVRFWHNPREQNKVVDHLVNIITGDLNRLCTFKELPTSVRILLSVDLQQLKTMRISH